MLTASGVSTRVVAGNAWFTLIGFMGMYTVLAILWLFLIYREIELGPDPGNRPTGEDAIVLPADLGGRNRNDLVLARSHHDRHLLVPGSLRSGCSGGSS